ncbi:MAG: hypothetical protein KDB00_17990 [Planctomycetales bacterium]|nr:hypothetical protein [Planctomycetales bacterium]
MIRNIPRNKTFVRQAENVRRIEIAKPSPETWFQIQTVFQEALKLPENERAAFVDRACNQDASLAGEVLTLLAVFDEAEDELESTPLLPKIESHSSHAPLMAEELAGYRFLNEIYRGGQGIVYRAIQLSTKRVVVVKVMIAECFAGADSKRRFEREVELVSSLRHAGIVPNWRPGSYLPPSKQVNRQMPLSCIAIRG